MLKSISWTEFFIAIFIGTVVYYGWWLVRFYPLLRKSGKGALPEVAAVAMGGEVVPAAGAKSAVAAVKVGVSDGAGVPVGTGVADAGENGTVVAKEKKEEANVPAVKTVFLPAVAGDLAGKLSGIFEAAGAGRMKKEEIAEAVRAVLCAEPFKRLKGTPFEEKINNNVIATGMEKYGPGRPDPKMVSGLWVERNG